MASIGHRSNKETWWPHKDLFHFREDLHQEEVQGIIKAFTANSKGPLRRIVVQRKNIWKSASAFWLLPTVQGRTGLLLCKFSGEVDNAEPSVDQGGPRREFFDLLKTSMIRESGLFSTGKLISYAYFVDEMPVWWFWGLEKNSPAHAKHRHKIQGPWAIIFGPRSGCFLCRIQNLSAKGTVVCFVSDSCSGVWGFGFSLGDRFRLKGLVVWGFWPFGAFGIGVCFI